jgi:chromosome segregation ATPase
MTSKSAALLAKIESTRDQSERVESQLATQDLRHQETQVELEKAQSVYSEIQEKRQLLQAQRQEHLGRVQTQEQEIRQLEKSKEQALRTLTQIKSKLQSLEELDESHEGLADGPKAALDWAKANGQVGQILALTDILEVSPGYESVLESWLENQLESLVTKNAQVVLPLLEQIQKDQQGRVTVQISQPQTKKSVKKKDTRPPQEDLKNLGFNFEGKLTEFIRWNEDYSSRLAPLFENVYLVESLDPLPALLSSETTESLEAYTLIAKNGAVFDSKGTIRGGSLKSSGAVGILRRKRSIEDLK